MDLSSSARTPRLKISRHRDPFGNDAIEPGSYIILQRTPQASPPTGMPLRMQPRDLKAVPHSKSCQQVESRSEDPRLKVRTVSRCPERRPDWRKPCKYRSSTSQGDHLRVHRS